MNSDEQFTRPQDVFDLSGWRQVRPVIGAESLSHDLSRMHGKRFVHETNQTILASKIARLGRGHQQAKLRQHASSTSGCIITAPGYRTAAGNTNAHAQGGGAYDVVQAPSSEVGYSSLLPFAVT